MIKLIIPNKYIQLLKDKDIEALSLTLEEGPLELTKEFVKRFNNFNFSSIETHLDEIYKNMEIYGYMELPNYIPEEWYKNDISTSKKIDYVTQISNYFKELHLHECLEINTKINESFYFYKEENMEMLSETFFSKPEQYELYTLEANQSLSRAITNFEKRIETILNYGLNYYKIRKKEDVLEPVSIYLSYLKDWKKIENSAGGGNITGFLSEKDIERLQLKKPHLVFIKQGLNSFRLKGKI